MRPPACTEPGGLSIGTPNAGLDSNKQRPSFLFLSFISAYKHTHARTHARTHACARAHHGHSLLAFIGGLLFDPSSGLGRKRKGEKRHPLEKICIPDRCCLIQSGFQEDEDDTTDTLFIHLPLGQVGAPPCSALLRRRRRYNFWSILQHFRNLSGPLALQQLANYSKTNRNRGDCFAKYLFNPSD